MCAGGWLAHLSNSNYFFKKNYYQKSIEELHARIRDLTATVPVHEHAFDEVKVRAVVRSLLGEITRMFVCMFGKRACLCARVHAAFVVMSVCATLPVWRAMHL